LDATKQETEIFGAIEHFTLSTALIEFQRTEKVEKEYKADNLLPANLWEANGGIVEFRMTQKVLKKEEVEDAKSDVDTAIVKQFASQPPHDGSAEMLRKNMYAELKEVIGIDTETVREVQELKVWQYFPHYSVEAIQNGDPWTVRDEMQGKYGNTYYIGSSVCFESTKDVVEYNIQLTQNLNF